MKKLLVILVLICSISGLFAAKPDQGRVSAKHVQDALRFKKKYFYNDEGKCCDLAKIKSFASRLQQEKSQLKHNLYETRIIEKLELEVTSLKKAKKSALKEKDEEKNELLRAYNEYLYPRIKILEKLANSPRNDRNFREAEGVLDEFVRVYSIFFVPTTEDNTWRNHFGMDYQHKDFIKKLRGYSFKFDDKKYVEANNLVVEDNNQGAINACLSMPMNIGDYLSLKNILSLKECGFDISKLNPGKNPFIEEVDQHALEDIRSAEPRAFFPGKKDKIYYDVVQYSGHGSPKFKAYVRQNGKKIKFKVKMGREVHSEIAASYLARFIGFSQDIMKNYHQVKIYFKDSSYEEFRAMYFRRYSEAALARFIAANGKDDNGEEWMIINDVLIESKDPSLMRLGGYDMEGWDLLNRREHRAEILFLAWLNIMDAKSANYKMLLQETKEGLKPVYRLHDLGYSLDRSLTVRRLDDAVKMISGEDRSVNVFPATFLKSNSKRVRIYWNDLVFRNGKRFVSTTFSDLKWMARKIAAIKERDIKFAFKESGMPGDIVDLYYHKVRMRRNEIVRAFGLQNEFKLFTVPNLKAYSPNKNVRKGKIVKTNYKGHNEYEVRRNSAATMLLENISISLPLFGLTDDFKFKLNSQTELDTTYEPVKIASSALLPGVRLILGRRVKPNDQRWNNENGGHGFVITDTIGIELGAGCDYANKMRKYLPLSVKGYLRVYKTNLQFVHYADSRKEAYSSSFKIFKIMRNLKEYAANNLKTGEVISRSDAFGLDLGAEVGVHVPSVDVFESNLGMQIQWFKESPIHFFRDHFGQLYIMKEKSKVYTLGAKFNALDLDLQAFSFSLIGMEYTRSKYFHNAELYSFSPPNYQINRDPVSQEQREEEGYLLSHLKSKRDLDAFYNLMNGTMSEVDRRVNRELSLDANGHSTHSRFRFLGIGSNRKEKNYSDVKMQLNDGEEFHFHRYSINEYNRKAFDKVPLPDNEDIIAPKGSGHSVTVEIDDANNDIGVHLLVRNYQRKASRKKVLGFIERENERFSKDDQHPFYAGYTLPPKEELNLYRKVYSDARIYINGEGIVNNLLSLTPTQLYQKAKKHYGRKNPVRPRRLRRAFVALKASHDDPKEFAKIIGKFFNTLKVRKYGVELLKDLVGEKNIHVYGQIYGIHRGYTLLQRTELKANLRFAGKSWGEYQLTPIRKFLKAHDILPRNVFMNLNVDMSQLLGALPDATPPMF